MPGVLTKSLEFSGVQGFFYYRNLLDFAVKKPYNGANFSNPYRENKGTYRQKTVAVKSLSNKNSWGCYDFHGNVREWCSDWYDYNYYSDYYTDWYDSGDYYTDGEIDPQEADNGTERVLRGGSWSDFAKDCRSSCRRSGSPSCSRIFCYGFRCSVALINQSILQFSE